MVSRWIRNWSPRLVRPVIQALLRLGVTPNQLTAGALVAAWLAGAAAGAGWLPLAGILILLGGTLDALDGELARQGHQESRLGPFIDSIADHYGDFAVYLGLTGWALAQEPVQPVIILLAMTALFGSVFGSHVRSRAGMLGMDTKTVGIFTRLERNLVFFLGLVTRQVLIMLVVLAVLNNLSAFQRVIYTLRAADQQPKPAAPIKTERKKTHMQ